MAIYEQQHQQQDNEETTTTTTTLIVSSNLLDELYCEEETWEEIKEQNEQQQQQHNMFCDNEDDNEEEELKCLLLKEKVILNNFKDIIGRKEAIEWMLRVNSHYGFNSLTKLLCVNYFDRCVSSLPFLQQQQQQQQQQQHNNNNNNNMPWTFQLLAVACVSLAAKVEETHVPLLLDLQVEGARLVFEPKDVQKMEVLVLSTLDWKMHPITPIPFLHHIIRRLGFNHHLHWDFLNKCETLLLSLLSDWRIVRYEASVLATATMMHVIDQIQPSHSLDYHFQLLNLLNFTKEKVKDCYELIVETSKLRTKMDNISKSKRKLDQMMMMMNNSSTYTTNNTTPSSPSGVMDAYWFSSDSSNDSWASTTTTTTTSTTTTVSGGRFSVSSPVSSRKKRGRVHEQPMTLQLPSLSRVFVDVIESPH